LRLLIGRYGLRIKNVKADVSLDYLSHESVHGTTACGNVMQHLGAFGLLIECPFDGLDLPRIRRTRLSSFFFSSVV
jgi:hypothetical protein